MRGIKVADEFLLPNGEGLKNFINCVGEKPKGRYSIDRLDTNGNYECGNMRWADDFQQARNRRSNHIIEYNGKSQTLTEWAEEIGIKPSALSARLHKLKLSIEEALKHGVAKAGCTVKGTKLKVDDVREIFLSKQPYKDIADKYQISLASISRIKNKIRYKEETKDL